MLFVSYLDKCLTRIKNLCDHSYRFVNEETLIVILEVYDNRKWFIVRVAGINNKIESVHTLYDAEVSEPDSVMIPINFWPWPRELSSLGIKCVNSHRILGIVVARNGKSSCEPCGMAAEVAVTMIWIQTNKR